MRDLGALLPLSLILALVGCASLIKWGWDEPDQAFLAAHIQEMERKPFDGLVLHLTVPGVAPHHANFSWHLADRAYGWEQVRPAVEQLSAVPFRRFRHNFLRVNLNPTERPLDLLDDETWEMVLANLRLAARAAREGGLRGLMIDPEAYAAADEADGRPRFNAFDYRRRMLREADFERYRRAAFERGRRVASILGETAPDLVLLFAFAYSFPCRAPAPAPEYLYGLLPAFVDGILAAKPREMVVVDGTELAYPFRSCEQFQEAYRRLRADCRRLSLDPGRYDRELTVGFGIWMDYESGKACAPYREQGTPCPWSEPALYPDDRRHLVDPRRLQEAVAAALDLTDRYVWLYSQEPKWWTEARPDGENLPEAFVRAIEGARREAVPRTGSMCPKPGLAR